MAQTISSQDKAIYKKLLSQINTDYIDGAIALVSLEFSYPDSYSDLPEGRRDNEPVEENETTWRYSFERTPDSIVAIVSLRNEIPDENGGDPIFLEANYKIFYKSAIELPPSLTHKFAYEKTLPHVWPYFRQQALDIYHKTGLKWVVIPFEPNALPE